MDEYANGPQGPSIEQIIGLSVKTPNLFSVQGNTLAYVAGNGIVVCNINEENESVDGQRFFCANINSGAEESVLNSQSSAHAYINMIENNQAVSETKKDSFGYSMTPIMAGSMITESPQQEDHTSGNTSKNVGQESSPLRKSNRIRSISCIAISPNRKLMAVGEAGYKPRIVIYSLARDSSKSPIAFIHEHTFGVNCLKFSPDSQYLCSLGFVNDGFIHVWKLSNHSINLISSNKCTSITNNILWHENYIITLGLRYVKVWQFEPEPKKTFAVSTLKGKNVIMGHFKNCNFIHAISFNIDEIFIITDCSKLFIIKLDSPDLKLVPLKTPNNSFNSIGIDYSLEHILIGTYYNIEYISFNELEQIKMNLPVKSPQKRILNSSRSSTSLHQPDYSSGQLFYTLGNGKVVFLSSNYEIVIHNDTSKSSKVLVPALINNIVGVKESLNGEFLIISKNGEVNQLFNDQLVSKVCTLKLPSSEVIENQLSCIDYAGDEIAFGDKYGHLFVGKLNAENKNLEVSYQTKAHSSIVNDLIFFEFNDSKFICSISRDRMIQFFYKNKVNSEWDILQTIPSHTGNLVKVLFSHNKLYVCSADRTISVHTIEANESGEYVVIQVKVITLKHTPLTMKIHDTDLIISTMDRSLFVYSLENYELRKTLKLCDATGKSLLIENLVIYHNYIIVSSSDKSLRAFTYPQSKQISLFWGHSDSILNLALKTEKNSLLSIGLDGCIFRWNLETITAPHKNIFNSPKSTKQTSDEFFPLYSKVARRILPKVPTKTSRRASITSSISPQATSISSPVKINPLIDASSPTPIPNLSSTTMRRLASNSPQNTSFTRSPLKSPKSPTRDKLLSLRRGSTVAHGKLRTTNSATKPNETGFDQTKLLLAKLKDNVSNNTFSDGEKNEIVESLDEVLRLIGYKKNLSVNERLHSIEDNYEEQLLEKFGNKLLNIFQDKIDTNKPTNQGIFRKIYSTEFDQVE